MKKKQTKIEELKDQVKANRADMLHELSRANALAERVSQLEKVLEKASRARDFGPSYCADVIYEWQREKSRQGYSVPPGSKDIAGHFVREDDLMKDPEFRAEYEQVKKESRQVGCLPPGTEAPSKSGLCDTPLTTAQDCCCNSLNAFCTHPKGSPGCKHVSTQEPSQEELSRQVDWRATAEQLMVQVIDLKKSLRFALGFWRSMVNSGESFTGSSTKAFDELWAKVSESTSNGEKV